jgi:hypothetical protein
LQDEKILGCTKLWMLADKSAHSARRGPVEQHNTQSHETSAGQRYMMPDDAVENQ